MQPIGPLMIEHRLIERMIRVMAGEPERMGETGRVDVALIDTAGVVSELERARDA